MKRVYESQTQVEAGTQQQRLSWGLDKVRNGECADTGLTENSTRRPSADELVVPFMLVCMHRRVALRSGLKGTHRPSDGPWGGAGRQPDRAGTAGVSCHSTRASEKFSLCL